MVPLVLLFAGVGVFWALKCADDAKRKTEIVNLPQFTAKDEIQSQLTNDVVGYSRTISIQVDDDKYYLTNWTAQATVEFMNAIGGIERTDIYYRCYATNVWAQDPEKTYLYYLNRVR